MNTMVVLSGGQDSTTCLFWARSRMQPGDELHAVTFDYGQKHRIEIDAARAVAQMARVDTHEIICVPECLESTSPLTSETELHRYKDFKQMEEAVGDKVEHTFVPMRNTLFLTIAANRAIARNCTELVTGVCEQDNANYPDCRAVFIQSMERTINLSLGYSFPFLKIHTPLMQCSKADTVRIMRALGPVAWDALAHTHTSYDGKYPPTDMNHANVLRAQGFLEADMPDPLVLRAVSEGLMDLPQSDNYRKEFKS